MLLKYHNQLMLFVFNFFKIFRCDFLPDSSRIFLNRARLLIFPIHVGFGTFCILWHFFHIKDFTDLMDVCFTCVFFFISYQSIIVYFGFMIFNKPKFMELFEYFDFLVTEDKSIIYDLRKKYLLENLKLTVYFSK